MAYPHRALSWLFDLIFPYRCICCRVFLNDKHLCERCLKALPIKKELECIGCRRPTPLGKTCMFCRDDNPVDQLFIVSDFNHPDVAALVKLFKYRFLRDLAVPMGHLAARHLNHIAKRDRFSIVQGAPLLVPVPLHIRRENWRGFNQAELIAREISKKYQLACSNDLVRTALGISQADLADRPERLLNAKGLYAVKSGIFRGRNVILVDDVCTTGATLNECARVLKESGAAHVAALAIARG